MRSIGNFAAAGLIHFFVGWTFLTLEQQRLGAARTGGMVGTAPLFGTALAALVLGELIRPLGLVGVVLVVAGVALLSLGRSPLIPGEGLSPWGVTFGLGAAVCWGTSPIFIRWGLEGLPYPLVGVTVGLMATALAYGTVLGILRPGRMIPAANRRILVLAGSVVAVAIAALWMALSLAPVAVVLALAQLRAEQVEAAFSTLREFENVSKREWQYSWPSLALMRHKAGKTDEAREWLRKAEDWYADQWSKSLSGDGAAVPRPFRVEDLAHEGKLLRRRGLREAGRQQEHERDRPG